jgi:hypothetical protein
VGPHDTIRGYRSPKHKVTPGSQGKPTPETLYKVVWHSEPDAGKARPNATSSARTSSYSISKNEILTHLYKDIAKKDYYSLGEITILTKEN